MKKRKIKLFASIASLAMVVAVMGVGVFAAAQQSATVSSTVEYTAKQVDATIKLTISAGTDNQDKQNLNSLNFITAKTGGASPIDYTTQQTIAKFVTSDTSNGTPTSGARATTIPLVLDDSNLDGKLNKDDTIVYTFSISNDSAARNLYAKVSVAEKGATDLAAGIVSTTLTQVGTTGYYTINMGGTNSGEFVVTYAITEDAETTITATTLPTITIDLTITPPAVA